MVFCGQGPKTKKDSVLCYKATTLKGSVLLLEEGKDSAMVEQRKAK